MSQNTAAPRPPEDAVRGSASDLRTAFMSEEEWTSRQNPSWVERRRLRALLADLEAVADAGQPNRKRRRRRRWSKKRAQAALSALLPYEEWVRRHQPSRKQRTYYRDFRSVLVRVAAGKRAFA